MRFGTHDPVASSSRRRADFRPRGERLESRQLMAIDLVNIANAPYGVLLSGQNNSGGVGFSVADVGDVNGDGFDDFVVGAPTITANNTGPALGSGAGGRVFLVFGSDQVTEQTLDWRTLTAEQRIGNLGALGNTQQTNPIDGNPGFAFNGLTFTTSQNPNSALGASVAAVGDVNGDGFADFLIGAPGANDASNGANSAGRAYLIYGSRDLSQRQTKTVDLDNTTANSDISILTFVNNVANATTGRSVASAGDVIPDGQPDIAIGAPTASVNGLPASGAVYVISGGFLRPARTQTVPLNTVGQGGTTNVPGVVFSGGFSGDDAGFSLAAVGNVGGATVGSLNQSDLLIGEPQFNVGPGQATLVYGASSLPGAGTTINGFNSIILSGAGTAFAGATFTGDASGDETGYAVAGAGDFNADGLGDILIGSPGFNSAAGRVNLVFGRRATTAVPALTGIYNLTTGIPPQTTGATPIAQAQFNGAAAGALAGFSLTATGRINNDSINEILIGSPGFNNSQGIAYLIPGNPDLSGVLSLTATESSPIQGLIIGLSQPATGNYFGSSVSGLFGPNGAGQTTDADNVGDFLIGSAGFALTSAQGNSGGVYVLEGAFVPLPNVVSTAIVSNIGVGQPTAPFAINATTPADLTLYILSGGSNTPGFTPFRDIDPATLTVNGVAVANPNFTQTADLDGDGIPDASFTFTPRSALSLPNGAVTFTITARTLATGNFPNRQYRGSTIVTVSGSGSNTGGNSGGLPSNRTTPFSNLGANSVPNLPFGERLVPTEAILRRLRYKPLPAVLEHRQFLPTNGFSYRYHQFYHPTKNKTFGAANTHAGNGGTFTLNSKIFSRGKFPNRTYVIRKK